MKNVNDAISRQAVDDAIYDYSRACDVNYGQIMEYIDKIPSVTPEQNDVLDKIRAEIEQEYSKFRDMSDKWCERANGLGTALDIIDRFRK